MEGREEDEVRCGGGKIPGSVYGPHMMEKGGIERNSKHDAFRQPTVHRL